MLKKILLILILPIIILVLIAVFFFKNPIQDYGTLYQSRSELVRDVSPQVTADLPSGWAILTYNSHMPFSDTVYEGLTDIVVLSQGKIIFYLSPVGDTGGGAGGNYYIFPDYDPSDLERMKGAPYMKFIEVEEGEYSKINFFGNQIRRVGHNLLPNRSEDERYFIAPSDPILFSFGQKGPSFDWFYVGSGDRRMVVSMHSSYEAFVYPEASQEQLEQLDKILSSMALK